MIRKLFLCLLLLASAPGFASGVNGSYFAVIVSDIEASREWYCDTLQLTEVSRHTQPGRFDIVNLTTAGLFVELLQLDAANPRPEGRIHGAFKVGMLVADLDAFAAGLPEQAEAPRIIDDTDSRVRLLQLRDPDGNTVQVMQQITE